MLEDHGIDYEYRDYRKSPLAEREIRSLLEMLAVEPREVLRSRDRAFRELSLTGAEPADDLIRCMASHPTLLERPIGVLGSRAIVGRPPERLLQLTEDGG